MNKDWDIETKAIQSGYDPKNGEPRIVPITQSTTYKYDDVESVAKLFDLEAAGHMYSRISNPTVEALEKKVADMEGGVGALALSSGQSANFLAILNICESGDHFVAAGKIYGGTFNLFTHTFKKLGIEVTFVDHEASEEEILKAFRPNTKVLFGETLTNPGCEVLDLEKFVSIARKAEVPCIIDNTFPTPYLCRPIEYGVDIVTHSSTKYLDGHATSVGGIIVDSGKFKWTKGKYPMLTEPDPSYHNLCYTETFKELAYIVKARVQLVRDFGNAMSPMNAFLTNLGIETLHVRMPRHSENSLALAKFLKSHPKVEWIEHPALEGSRFKALSEKYLSLGCAGVFTCGIKGGRDAAEKFMNALKLAKIVVHVGDIRTCVLHPASMTHRQLNEEEQRFAGVTPGLIRVSVGLESIRNIIDDFKAALDAV